MSSHQVDSPLAGWGLPDDTDALLPLNYHSRALEASCVVKTGPGVLYGFTFSSTLGAAQYVQVFDASSLPADGAVPIIAKSCAANDAVMLSWLPGRTFLVGIIICNSTTNGSKTLGAANSIFDAQFV